MKKQIIEFKESEYEQAIVNLDKAITNINNAIIILIANGMTEIDLPLIKKLAIDRNEYINNIYRDKLNNICNVFGINAASYDFTKDDVIKRMANCSVQYLWEAGKILCFSYLVSYLLDDKYIVINNNEAIKADGAEFNLKEYYTIYAQTDKQNKANEILSNICNEFKQLENIGISPYNFFNIFGLYKVNEEWKIKGKCIIENLK